MDARGAGLLDSSTGHFTFVAVNKYIYGITLGSMLLLVPTNSVLVPTSSGLVPASSACLAGQTRAAS